MPRMHHKHGKSKSQLSVSAPVVRFDRAGRQHRDPVETKPTRKQAAAILAANEREDPERFDADWNGWRR